MSINVLRLCIYTGVCVLLAPHSQLYRFRATSWNGALIDGTWKSRLIVQYALGTLPARVELRAVEQNL